jgi:hypothetical protein
VSNKIKTDAKPGEFITLDVSTVGFVVYGIGAGAKHCTFQEEGLPKFLERLWVKMWALKETLNKSWKKLDKENLQNRVNGKIIREYLEVATWAYAISVELGPFEKACVDGPTNPLRHIYIRRLEEIFTNCFAVANIYGSPEQSMVGLRGLLTDFESNGGIDVKTGGTGFGFDISLWMYYTAYFRVTNRSPLAYERFGELIEALSKLINKHYPKVSVVLAKEIEGRLNCPNHGFGDPTITSPAKTAMILKLQGISEGLLASDKQAKAA